MLPASFSFCWRWKEFDKLGSRVRPHRAGGGARQRRSNLTGGGTKPLRRCDWFDGAVGRPPSPCPVPTFPFHLRASEPPPFTCCCLENLKLWTTFSTLFILSTQRRFSACGLFTEYSTEKEPDGWNTFISAEAGLFLSPWQSELDGKSPQKLK